MNREAANAIVLSGYFDLAIVGSHRQLQTRNTRAFAPVQIFCSVLMTFCSVPMSNGVVLVRFRCALMLHAGGP
jgi:hypothetical protein